MGTELVRRGDDNGVTTLTLDRPERRNALSGALVDRLIARLDEVDADDSVRVVVLCGEGPSFCAGGDLGGGMVGEGMLADHKARARYAELLARMPRVGKPIVAAVHGEALGGGFGLAMACDLVVVDPAAKLGTPEIRVGLFPMIILAVLQRNVPRKPLLEMILDGTPFSADRAAALDLVNRVSAPGEALTEARGLAARIASRSPAVLALGKAAFYQVADQPYDQALAYLSTQLTLNLLTEDAMEGISAFLGKRTPNWKGR